MKSLGVIRIKKRTQPEWLIWLIIVMPFLFGTFIDFLGLPSGIKYILDIAWVLLVLYLFLSMRRKYFPTREIKGLVGWVVIFFLYTLVAYIPQYQSAVYYAWGIRNNFRYYIAFFAFAAFMKKQDISYYLALFDRLFWINAIISAIQYFVFGIYGDNLGGLFGNVRGCNAYTNLFFVIISARTLVSYLNGQESIKKCLAKCITMLAISAIAELKFFYIEFAIILAAAVLITDFSWRKLFIILFGTLGVMLGAYGLSVIFPNSAGFLSIEGILKIAASKKGYTSSGDLNRLTAIPIISQRFLKTGVQRMFGMGLGNCESASYAFLTTPFYSRYSYLRYQWFSIANWFLETGYIGLGFFFGFFILVILKAMKMKKATVTDRCYCQQAVIVAVCCIMIAVYNSSLRMESGYMAYFVLALPFAKQRMPGYNAGNQTLN